MKDKFEEVITKIWNEVPMSSVNSTIKAQAKACNTLHKQAMKEKQKENDRLKVIIFNLEDEIAEFKIPK